MVVDRVQRLELSESGVHESFLLEGNKVGKPARFATLGRSDCESESGPAMPSTQELMFCVRSVVRCRCRFRDPGFGTGKRIVDCASDAGWDE